MRRTGDFGRGGFIYDFGQNIVGRVRVKLRAPRGTLIQIRHAERLDDDGELYTANLRKAAATDLYTCSGNPDGEAFEPRFTFHGFQFAEVSGHFADAAIEDVTAIVLASALTGDRRVPLRPSVAQSAAEQHSVEPTRQFRRRTDGLPATRRTPRLDRRCTGVRAHRRVQSRRRGVLRKVAGRSDRCAVRQRHGSAARAGTAAAHDHARRRRSGVVRCHRDLSVDDLPLLRRQTPARASLRCDEGVRRQHRERAFRR